MDRRGLVGSRSVRTVLVLALVYAASLGAVYFRPLDGNVATWWPAAGISAALLLVTERRYLLLVAVGSAVASGSANWTAGRPLALAALLGVCNALESVVVVAVLRRISPGGRERLDGPEDFGRLFVACAAGALVLGTSIGLTIGLMGAGPGLAAAGTTATSHLAANLVVLPLLLLWDQRPRVDDLTVELPIQVSLFVVATAVVFGPGQHLAVVFVPLSLLVWAGLRLGAFVAGAELLLLAVVSTLLTARGAGPFASGAEGVPPTVSGWLVQAFVVCAALVTLPPCLAMTQRTQLLTRIATERNLNESTLNTTGAIILVTDPVGTVLRANATLERLSGHHPADLVGLPMWATALVPPERRGMIKQMFSDASGALIPATREADIVTADGNRLLVVWTNEVVRDDTGRAMYAVLTATDVTGERTQSGLVAHLLDATTETAIIGVDVEGRVSVFNRGAEELLGYRLEEVHGRPLSEVVACGDLAEHVAHGAAPVTTDWSWRTRRGRTVTMSTTTSRVHNVVGKHIGFMCVARDVTEQRRTQEMLVRALDTERQGMERLRRLDAAKDEFISTVSHELRTPTTSIVGYTEMLLDGDVGEPGEEQVPMLEAIARNGRRLISLAGDLLTLAGLDSESLAEQEREEVDLAQVALHAEEAVRPLVARRDLRVRFEIPTHPVLVVGDASHLDRVLINLLSNAVKFTPDGGSVTCRLEAGAGTACLEVSDTGIGIPEEEQGELFTRFFRSSNAQHAAIQGTGLGLSIIDQIVTAHGGGITVASSTGEGTTFTVSLPSASAALAPLTGEPGTDDRAEDSADDRVA